MNIEEKENAEGNKNNPNLNNISSFLINFKKYFANTLFFNYCDNLSFIKFICNVVLSWEYLKTILLIFYSRENLNL